MHLWGLCLIFASPLLICRLPPIHPLNTQRSAQKVRHLILLHAYVATKHRGPFVERNMMMKIVIRLFSPQNSEQEVRREQ